jgi:potassium uptake TrkH family protein
VVVSFALVIAVGTALLLLPVARAGSAGASVVDALFTATSAVCVTGLVSVDTPQYWSPFGHVVILALIQVGGFGIMAMTTLLVLLVSQRVGLRDRLNAAAESQALGLGGVRGVLLGVAQTSMLFEAVGAALLTARLVTAYDEAPGRALWHGVFHSVSAFNNAGFALYSDSLMGFADDPIVTLSISVLVYAGALGFPVLFELYRAWRTPRSWSLHTKLVMVLMTVLFVIGTAMYLLLEWSNRRTFGAMGVLDKVVNAAVLSVQARSGGFNTVDTGALNPETLLGTDVLMFIGAGSAGTGGGIKVTTFVVLLFVIVTEVRGDDHVTAYSRSIPREVQRQAMSVALVSVAVVLTSTALLLLLTPFTLDEVLFEAISAFCTVGLSTGITGEVGPAGHLVLTALMFVGRLGPITFASALALRSRPRRYELPMERPMIG